MASQSHTVTLAVLRAFRGPNILGPLPGGQVRCSAPRDITQLLRAALKDICQRAGIVLAGLQTRAEQHAEEWQSELWFQTPTPALGAAAARLAVAQVEAFVSGQEWDGDEAVFALADQRRRGALPLAALQLMAEAGARRVPAFQHGDALQLGYGVAGRRVALAPEQGETIALAGHHEPPRDPAAALDWTHLGRIPIIAATGHGAEQVVERLHTLLPHASAVTHASFDAARDVLASSTASQAIMGLDARDLLEQGAPFERCDASIILGAATWPAGEQERTEWAHALGLPMLLTAPGGVALLDADSPELLALAEYAACRLILVSRVAANAAVQAHCRAGGWAAWLDGGQIRAWRQNQITTLGEGDMAGLAARILQWAGALG
ncbi:MAG TPA: DUF4938 domain-containing protein [Roseiflexaceae bacterium]|nr:DUF4938 domain-containing protein [Roseiflexaceae bacterium]